MDGIALAPAFDPDRRPAVVFVTADDAYALSAFETHALDYLLKPFSAQRFGSALTYSEPSPALPTRLPSSQPRPMAGAGGPATERLVVKSSGRIYFVRVADIDWCEAAGIYIRPTTANTSCGYATARG